VAPTQQSGACPLIPPNNPGVPSCGCSLVGVWALNSNHGSEQGVGAIEFTPEGAYYGGPTGTDLSRMYAYDGAWSMSEGGSRFQLIYSCGDGCNGDGTFDVQFLSNCAVAILTERFTACTGTRIVVAGNVVLTRK
jgi:hypothetical protein